MAEEKLSEAEQAAQDANAETIASEQSWASKVEERLAALEDKAGLNKAAKSADTKEESK